MSDISDIVDVIPAGSRQTKEVGHRFLGRGKSFFGVFFALFGALKKTCQKMNFLKFSIVTTSSCLVATLSCCSTAFLKQAFHALLSTTGLT
jgi:hypothetical protein